MTAGPALPGRLVLLGHPVAHSASPAFQNAALEAAGIPLRYEALDVPPVELDAVLRALRTERAAGNVTIPHKPQVFVACDRVTGVARRAGAVNTFWCEGEALCGDNSDVAGFDAAVETLGTPREAAIVVLLGAGGSAAAVCAAVERWPGARVRAVARRQASAEALRERFPSTVRVPADLDAALSGARLVVNATPIGMNGDDEPIDVGRLSRDVHVMDLVYRPGETPWVRRARARGLQAMDGREMLLQQGAASFRRWFNQSPDLAVMRAAMERATPR